MSKTEVIQDLIDRAEQYRTEVTKSKLDNSFINDLDFTDIMKQHQTETDIHSKDNIYVECRVKKEEVTRGCTKPIKISRINDKGNKEKNIIQVKIPSNIENGQHIVIRENGNYINNRCSDLIIKVILK